MQTIFHPHSISRSARFIRLGFLSRPKFRAVIPVSIWILAVICGFAFLLNFSNTPGTGSPSDVSSMWPEDSMLERNPLKATLVMFVHPKCPCSRASLGELEIVLTHWGDRLVTHIVFVQLKNVTSEWTQSDLQYLAQRIPGVKVFIDNEGREAKLFGAKTSGWVVMYDTQKRLAFCGGITSSRSHHGTNIGRESLVEQLIHPEDVCRSSLVFGCPLWSEREMRKFIEK